jgi:DNA-binding MarR family transcriptional regulator
MTMKTKNRIIDLVIALKHSCIVKEDSIREEFSLSPAEYRGILAINSGDAVSAGELSAKMGLSVSRGSRVIEKLTKNGYLKRTGDSNDRRCLTIALADKGLKVRTKIDKMLERCEKEFESKIPKSEIKSFINSLDKLTLILHGDKPAIKQVSLQ